MPPRAMWATLHLADSMQECRDFIKGGHVQGVDGMGLSFKWASSPGDGVKVSRFSCISHKGCPVIVRAVNTGSDCQVQVILGEDHTIEINEKRRKNGVLSDSDLDMVKLLVDGGTKPAAILTTLTGKKLDEQKEGGGPKLEKRKEGGLKGEPM